ncbi:cytochrome P450 2J2-like [Pleurodeles waltl]|uniref:cytochrome P450 2J2-like n=1 Tax=Pleurodeles waltl TaxID=8319 RepID=UPI003709B92D
MLHNLALRRQVPFLQEEEAGGGRVKPVEPVDSDKEEAEDVDNRTTIIQHLGRTPVVILNGYQVVKEAFVQSAVEFAGRPVMPILEWFLHGRGILTAPYGPSWKQQRRFTLMTLRNFGLGKKSLEARISEESTFLIRAFQETKGQPFDPQFKVTNAVSNIICSLVFGNRFEYSDAKFQYLLHLLSNNVRLAGGLAAQMVNMCPFFRPFPGPHQKILDNACEIFQFIDKTIQEHRQTLDAENPKAYIDAYLLEMDKQNSNPDSTFSSENLQACIADLFVAGTDTTSTTLRWGFLYMITYPDIQIRCQHEIEQVVGWDRLPAWDDRLQMLYVEATINEILRFGNISPAGVFREVTKDTTLRGYHLTKGTSVISNMTSLFFDPLVWKESSSSQRVCPGEQLARMELFMFFTSLLQNLDIFLDDKEHRPDFSYTSGLVRAPHPYKLSCRTQPQSFMQNAEK